MPRSKKCEMAKRGVVVAGCLIDFEKQRMGQKVCSPSCAYAFAMETKWKKAKKKTQGDRLKLNQESVTNWHNCKYTWSTAYWMHRWVRTVRDKDEPCISCGMHRNSYDAGHYRTRGAAGHLRYHEDNVHKQCVRCNQHGGGTVGEYRIALLTKIGLLRIVALENNNAIKKWTVDECIVLRDYYKNLCKESEKALSNMP